MAPPLCIEKSKAKESCLGKKGLVCSTMKEQYLPPRLCYEPEPKEHYVRRERFKNKVITEVTKELEDELSRPHDTQNYCTTYDSEFQIDGFKIKSDFPIATPEALIKYPLYRSLPLTYYTQQIKEVGTILKLTKIIDPTNPFKKNGDFTKPASERYDDNIY